jgi:hypothetical protein
MLLTTMMLSALLFLPLFVHLAMRQPVRIPSRHPAVARKLNSRRMS